MKRRALLAGLAAALSSVAATVTIHKTSNVGQSTYQRGRRVAVSPLDPGYEPHSAFVIVLFNGKPLDNCVMADEALGEVHCYAQPWTMVPFTNEPAIEVKHGVVWIGTIEGYPPEGRLARA